MRRFVFAVLAMMAVNTWSSTPLGAEEPLLSEEARREWLLANTYLGHAAQVPGESEPVEVLERYLQVNAHAARLDLGREAAIWEAFTWRYPESRFAFAGLGRVWERLREERPSDRALLEKAVAAYSRAAELGLKEGRLLYTDTLASLIGSLGDKRLLVETFERLLGSSGDSAERYLALLDYADALAHLGDERAWERFEQALDLDDQGEGTGDALTVYAQALVNAGHAEQALSLVESRTSRELRTSWMGEPLARLRREAQEQLGRDTGSADEEIREIEARHRSVGSPDPAAIPRIPAPVQKFVHAEQADDCRSSGNKGYVEYKKVRYPNYIVNLAEILYNEARSENRGAKAMVGWTVRNRVFRKPTCDSYYGGHLGAWTADCLKTVPCTDSSDCNLSIRYCCVEHGGTTAVKKPHSQFDDAHRPMETLEKYGLLALARALVDGWLPDVSIQWPGQNGCRFDCENPVCLTPVGRYEAPLHGPMEYLAYEYTPRKGTDECKDRKGFVCGNKAPNNYFWNRKVTAEPQIRVRDNGNLLDDSFQLAIDGNVICQTEAGKSKECAAGRLTPGKHTLTITVLFAPDDQGTFEILLLKGVTFVSGGGTFVTDTLPQGSSKSYQIQVPSS